MELVPGLLEVPGLFVVPGLFEVPGLAKPVSGLPLPVTGRTAWLAPYQHTLAIAIIHFEADQHLHIVTAVCRGQPCQSLAVLSPCQQRWS